MGTSNRTGLRNSCGDSLWGNWSTPGRKSINLVHTVRIRAVFLVDTVWFRAMTPITIAGKAIPEPLGGECPPHIGFTYRHRMWPQVDQEAYQQEEQVMLSETCVQVEGSAT